MWDSLREAPLELETAGDCFFLGLLLWTPALPLISTKPSAPSFPRPGPEGSRGASPSFPLGNETCGVFPLERAALKFVFTFRARPALEGFLGVVVRLQQEVARPEGRGVDPAHFFPPSLARFLPSGKRAGGRAGAA